MESKPLQQAIDLTLDSMSMQGPVKRRDVGEAVMRCSPADHWSINDLHDAQLAYVMSEVTTRMSAVHTHEYIKKHMSNVPEDLLDILEGVPRFICITPSGGINSEHVLSYIATPDDWQKNAELKDRHIGAVRESRDVSIGVRDYLVHNNAKSISDLVEKK